MKLFLDSVDSAEIKKYSALGIIDGLTTNPSLMVKSKIGFYETVSELTSLVKEDVSIEVIAKDFDDMVKEGERILDVAKNIVVKLPITWDGIRACKYFADKGRKVNMTLCFSANQALLAAKVGATYVSPFIGRLEDAGEDGLGLIAEIREIYDNAKFETKILAASIRTVAHVTDAALCGADYATLPANIMDELVKHPLTDKGLAKFDEDWAKSGMRI
ncbi:MAG: fructose-6-phosphate aldolase [Rickettsiales bacterium]|nr:MAG: fructose-6-phosphate aldolase [Rickettsiales bacterium]